MPISHHLTDNKLLTVLPGETTIALHPHLELVQLERGELLCDAGTALRYAYFPTTAILSIVSMTDEGASIEIGAVGKEGVVGVNLFMGEEVMPYQVTVGCAGYAYRLKAQLFKQEFDHGGMLQRVLLRYTQAFLLQVGQNAICNRRHTIDQQLCRWLLFTIDRLPGDELNVTQELIASMLGVRREGVTEAAGKLQKSHLIEYSRGRIAVLDRAGLEERACDCYDLVKTAFDRLIESETAETGDHECSSKRAVDSNSGDASQPTWQVVVSKRFGPGITQRVN